MFWSSVSCTRNWRTRMLTVLATICMGLLCVLLLRFLTGNQVFRHPRTINKFSDTNQITALLSKYVRVLCFVTTTKNYKEDRAMWVKKSWGKRCNKILFISDENDPSLPSIDINIPYGRASLWPKTMKSCQILYDQYLDQFDWFLKADDDTFVIVENLRFFLAPFDPNKKLYVGLRFKRFNPEGYMSGGASYALSRAALKALVEQGFQNTQTCNINTYGSEDVQIGRCMSVVGATFLDTRDSLGRERFHGLNHFHHTLDGYRLDKTWLPHFLYYQFTQGPQSIADYPISYHYLSGKEMYVLDYFLHNIKVFGLHSDGLNSNSLDLSELKLLFAVIDFANYDRSQR